MAQIQYNGITLTNSKITRFQTQDEFEGDNFNRTRRKHIVEGVGILGNLSPFTTSLGSAKNALTVPGKQLSVAFDDVGGSFSILADGYDGSANYQDASNGPIPEINITEIAGGSSKATFLVAFTFTWFGCGSAVIQRAEIITTHRLNDEGYLTIERRGYLSISASNGGSRSNNPVQSSVAATYNNPYANPLSTNATASNASPSPDMYRRLVAGSCPPNFQRTKQDFYVEADQVTLAFTIEDTELFVALPNPVLNGDGSFEYSRGLQEGDIQGVKTFRIEFASNRDTHTEDLFMRCLEVALTKIHFTGTHPDIIQSFKVTQSSLFKRNVIALEIVAWGTMGSSSREPGGMVDEWLYIVLFNTPNYRYGNAYSDPYGSQSASSSTNAAPFIRYDPCTLNSTWQAITASAQGVMVGWGPDSARDQDPVGLPDEVYQTNSGDNSPDSQLEDDAAKIVQYRSSQSIDCASNCNFLVPMGFGPQYGFQFALPDVMITQKVDMVTRDDTMPIPWPALTDAFIVLSQSIQINDATPDASGNRLFVVHATRSVKVSVHNSPNTRRIGGGESLAPAAGVARSVWSPSAMLSARHPITGSSYVNLQENLNGTVQRQDYVYSSTAESGGDTRET